MKEENGLLMPMLLLLLSTTNVGISSAITPKWLTFKCSSVRFKYCSKSEYLRWYYIHTSALCCQLATTVTYALLYRLPPLDIVLCSCAASRKSLSCIFQVISTNIKTTASFVILHYKCSTFTTLWLLILVRIFSTYKFVKTKNYCLIFC